MPFVNLYTNVHIGASERDLKKRLGRAITEIPGKSESSLMIRFAEDQHLYMSGDGDQPAAMVELKVKGHFETKEYDAFCRKLTMILQEELGIRPNRIYLQITESEIWGVNGGVS